MTPARERNLIRMLHLVLSIPLLGYLYGPVASIPPAAFFAHWIAMPLVIASGLWLWLKPRIVRHFRNRGLAKRPAHAPASELHSM